MAVGRVADRVLAALDEDRSAAWVPDVRGADGACDLGMSHDRQASSTDIEWFSVPKPDGTRLRAPLLCLSDLAALHEAVEPLLASAGDILAPGVCGYRAGAEAGAAYSREHRRFTEIAAAEAATAGTIVSADVRRFFAATSWASVVSACRRVLPAVDLAPLVAVAEEFQSRGLTHLPPGYADARFLANLVLVHADGAIGLPFTRWVDDYRFFAPTVEAAEAALERLSVALGDLGLMLNTRKVRIQAADEYLKSCGQSFASVYHPDYESERQVQAALRSIFMQAAPDPRVNRRSLRFVLPRLAAERDDIAVEWALSVLQDIPWEVPRLTAYLSAFADRTEVQVGVSANLMTALDTGETWVAARLAALACWTGLSADAAVVCAAHLRHTESPSLWGLLLRALALSGYDDAVVDALRERVLDPRAAVAARHDLAATADGRGETTSRPSMETIL